VWLRAKVYTKEHGNAVILSHRGNGALVIDVSEEQTGNPHTSTPLSLPAAPAGEFLTEFGRYYYYFLPIFENNY
jgi:hypothetical protein